MEVSNPSSDETLNNALPQRTVPRPEPTLFRRVYSWGYVVIRAVISGTISGGINYGIAFVMYSAPSPQPHAYKFPSTVVGDFAVTSLIQGIIIWMLTVFGTFGDLRSGLGLPYVGGDSFIKDMTMIQLLPNVESRRDGFIRFWVRPSHKIDVLAPSASSSERSARLYRNMKLAGCSALISIPFYGLLAIAFVFSLYGVEYYERQTAIVMKAVFGGVSGFISSFLITWIVFIGVQLTQFIEAEAEKKAAGV
ncbi:hypothetical protein HDU79_003125 [Rhizoclosmatium sp. JEL0117]|nr:hypothetical protein HDU79_003125 [Rhizoclosmatium sp. JEL0117]